MTTNDLFSESISSSCVCSAVKLFKPHKHDSTILMSDHLILAEPEIADFVTTLCTCILRHGYMPLDLRDCILVLIPKGYKDTTSSDNNYHPVILAPTLSKALEWSILLAYPRYFTTSHLQFGFKKGLSTSLCTGLIKNVVSR